MLPSRLFYFLVLNKHLPPHLVLSDKNEFYQKNIIYLHQGIYPSCANNFKYVSILYSPLAHWILWWYTRIIILAPNLISLILDIPINSWQKNDLAELGNSYPPLDLENNILIFLNWCCRSIACFCCLIQWPDAFAHHPET